jgi:hypothetical protein
MRVLLFKLAFLLVILLPAISTRADIPVKQARKLIAGMEGFRLKTGAVRVKRISAGSQPEATADIQLAFRFEREHERWLVAEIRTGPSEWEDLESIFAATRTTMPQGNCDAAELSLKGDPDDLSARRARCLLAALFGIELPSDAIRIQDVSMLNVPLSTQPSALVEAIVRVDARLTNDGKSGWRVSALRSGNRDWVSLSPVVAALNAEKERRTRADLDLVVKGLESFHAERGSYVTSDKHGVLIDHLTPRHLTRVIRLDAWRRPYQYLGDANHYTLRSLGPDGKENTADDIVISGPVR